MYKTYLFFLLVLGCTLSSIIAQDFQPNYDEDEIPSYTLADPLIFKDGTPVKNVEDWTRRRAEIFDLFERLVYGKTPTQTLKSKVKVHEDRQALNGKAIRKEITITFKNKGKKLPMNILMYLPPNKTKPVPVFMGYNFYGNHTIHPDPNISLATSWLRNNKSFGITNNVATEASRGVRASRWPVEDIIARGYGLATIYYGDIDPDFDDGFENGIHALFTAPSKPKLAADEWGSIAAWTWGLSRALDYLETDKDVDAKKVSVIGHSRLGKTSLWAGAVDTRFALVISNDSGCGGAALSKRSYGETVGRINRAFPHWFCDNFNQYNENEGALPVDQHLLIAIIAPRPVYIASATEDQWADPKGEFLAGVHASPVYTFLGKEGLPTQTMPKPEKQVMGSIGYHIRTGKHDITAFDWKMFMNFADKHLE